MRLKLGHVFCCVPCVNKHGHIFASGLCQTQFNLSIHSLYEKIHVFYRQEPTNHCCSNICLAHSLCKRSMRVLQHVPANFVGVVCTKIGPAKFQCCMIILLDLFYYNIASFAPCIINGLMAYLSISIIIN